MNDKTKFPYPITATAFNDSDDGNKYKLKIERTDFQDLNLSVSLKLSGLSSSTITTNDIQKIMDTIMSVITGYRFIIN